MFSLLSTSDARACQRPAFRWLFIPLTGPKEGEAGGMHPGLDLAQLGGRPQSCQAGPLASSQPWAWVREESALFWKARYRRVECTPGSLLPGPGPHTLGADFPGPRASKQGGQRPRRKHRGQPRGEMGRGRVGPASGAPEGHVGPRHRADGHARSGVGRWAQISHSLCWSGRPGSA